MTDLEKLKDAEILTKSFKMTDYDLEEKEGVAFIKGYGSTFGNADLGGDIVEKGAFAKTLNDKNGRVYFLKDHRYDMDNLLGVAYLSEDEKGLLGEYEINIETEQGRNAYSFAKQMQKAKMPLGLSIGYSVIKDEWDRNNDIRRIKEVKLYEVSLTPFPMNEQARLTDAKSLFIRLQELEDEIKTLKEGKNSLKDEPLTDTQKFDAELKKALENLHKQIKTK